MKQIVFTALFLFINPAHAMRCFEIEPDFRLMVDQWDQKTLRAEGEKAAKKLKAYVEHANTVLYERDYFFKLLTLAVMGREHILIEGPPGSAKTLGVLQFFNNIMGARVFFHQASQETTKSDLLGDVDYSPGGRRVRQYKGHLLDSDFAVIDEKFDLRPGAYRLILGPMQEREDSSGGETFKGRIGTIVATTNKYTPEVYSESGKSDKPRAAVDRYLYVVLVPAELHLLASHLEVANSAERPWPELHLNDLIVLQKLVNSVKTSETVAAIHSVVHFRVRPILEQREEEARSQYLKDKAAQKDPTFPYKSVKYTSPRTYAKAATKALRAAVVWDFVQKKGNRRLAIRTDDLWILENVYASNSAPEQTMSEERDRASREVEVARLEAQKFERETIRTVLREVMHEFNKRNTELAAEYKLNDISNAVRDWAELSRPDREAVTSVLRELYGLGKKARMSRQKDVTGATAAELSLIEFVEDAVNSIFRDRAPQILRQWSQPPNIHFQRADLRARAPEHVPKTFRQSSVAQPESFSQEPDPKNPDGPMIDFSGTSSDLPKKLRVALAKHKPSKDYSPQATKKLENFVWAGSDLTQLELVSAILDEGADPRIQMGGQLITQYLLDIGKRHPGDDQILAAISEVLRKSLKAGLPIHHEFVQQSIVDVHWGVLNALVRFESGSHLPRFWDGKDFNNIKNAIQTGPKTKLINKTIELLWESNKLAQHKPSVDLFHLLDRLEHPESDFLTNLQELSENGADFGMALKHFAHFEKAANSLSPRDFKRFLKIVFSSKTFNINAWLTNQVTLFQAMALYAASLQNRNLDAEVAIQALQFIVLNGGNPFLQRIHPTTNEVQNVWDLVKDSSMVPSFEDSDLGRFLTSLGLNPHAGVNGGVKTRKPRSPRRTSNEPEASFPTSDLDAAVLILSGPHKYSQPATQALESINWRTKSEQDALAKLEEVLRLLAEGADPRKISNEGKITRLITVARNFQSNQEVQTKVREVLGRSVEVGLVVKSSAIDAALSAEVGSIFWLNEPLKKAGLQEELIQKLSQSQNKSDSDFANTLRPLAKTEATESLEDLLRSYNLGVTLSELSARSSSIATEILRLASNGANLSQAIRTPFIFFDMSRFLEAEQFLDWFETIISNPSFDVNGRFKGDEPLFHDLETEILIRENAGEPIDHLLKALELLVRYGADPFSLAIDSQHRTHNAWDILVEKSVDPDSSKLKPFLTQLGLNPKISLKQVQGEIRNRHLQSAKATADLEKLSATLKRLKKSEKMETAFLAAAKKLRPRQYDRAKTAEAQKYTELTNSKPELAKFEQLIRDGADPNALYFAFAQVIQRHWNRPGGTNTANKKDWIAAIQLMIQYGLDLSLMTTPSGSPLEFAIHLESEGLLKLFLEAGATYALPVNPQGKKEKDDFGPDLEERTQDPKLKQAIGANFSPALSPMESANLFKFMNSPTPQLNEPKCSTQVETYLSKGADPNVIYLLEKPFAEWLNQVVSSDREQVLDLFLQHPRLDLGTLAGNNLLKQFLVQEAQAETTPGIGTVSFSIAAARKLITLGVDPHRAVFNYRAQIFRNGQQNPNSAAAKFLQDIGLDKSPSSTQQPRSKKKP